MVETAEKTVEILNDVMQRKVHSLAAYLAEASPYVPPQDRPIQEAIEAAAAAGRRQAAEAARLILKLEGVPQSGGFSPGVVESNYLCIRYLLPRVLQAVEQDLAVLEQYHAQCTDGEVKDFLARVIAEDRALRDRLDALHAQPPAA